MSQLKVCVKCKKPVIKNQKAFKQADGSIIHGECYNCDQCNANMVGKKVGSVPSDDGKEYIKVCWNCMMKHPHYSIIYGGQSGTAATQKQAVDKIDICKKWYVYVHYDRALINVSIFMYKANKKLLANPTRPNLAITIMKSVICAIDANVRSLANNMVS